MDKKWRVLINGVLWTEKLTQHGAERVAQDLRQLGKQNVSVAYRITEKERV